MLAVDDDEIKYGDLTMDEKIALQDMFSDTNSGYLGAGKTRRILPNHEDKRKVMQVGIVGSPVRPKAFPEEYWEFVDPVTRGQVEARYKSFTNEEYLKDCVQKVVKDLDICSRDSRYKPPWLVSEKRNVSEDKADTEELDSKLLRAQALANLDVYFFPDPDRQELAKDVLAEIHTVDERPFKCKPRKLSAVQQAFLTHKTNVMLRTGKLEHSKSSWCHGLVLVPYTDRIDAFMNKHGEKALEEMFRPERGLDVF